MKIRKNLLLFLTLLLFGFSVLTGCEAIEEETGTVATGKLEVHYIDVGQGDCILLQNDSHSMLIDAGNNDKGTLVCEYLESRKIEKLDLVIATHGDADHIGGLDVVMKNYDCGTVWMTDRKRDTKTYRDVVEVIEEKEYSVKNPKTGDTFMLGSAKVTVVAPVSDDYGSNENEYSIGVRVDFGENSFLFTGDAEQEAEADMLENGIDLDCDVFKIAHHGSSNANTSEFLDAVLPEYVVISCAEGNDYGHPHAEVMNELRSRGIKVFRTDEQGVVVATADGKTITFNMSPSDSWLSGTQLKSDKEDAANESNETIIGNKNSKKYHTTDCGNLPKEENRVYFDSESEAKKQGYEKCGNCEG